MFEPRVAIASLSGESDAGWARAVEEHVGAAFLGGIAIDRASREAAREMVADRDREEFLPEDPFAFVDRELAALDDAPVQSAVNVRSATAEPVRRAAAICDRHDAILEINAHCRQEELRDAGCGETLLADVDRLQDYVATASAKTSVSVKVRAEVAGVDLVQVARRIEQAGADAIHVDAMDSEAVVATVASQSDLFVIANNGVRDRETAREYLEYGADAVSVGRPSDRPEVLERVRRATREWFAGREARP
ncbi:MAG: tRNA-dihydrouridine synthase [Halanaeroarchaeum sp.]